MIKPSIGTNRVLVIAAIFLATFTNVAFFQNLFAGLSDTPWVIGHFLSVAMVLLCLLVIFLSVLSSRPLIKPALVLVFMFSAIAAYFMDTFNVIIDADMIANVMATDIKEAGDLLTPRLFLYILLLGMLPSALVLYVELKAETITKALGARLKLTGTAIIVVIVLVMSSSAFYISFLREHKELRYYANPLTPVYAIYKSAQRTLAAGQKVFVKIGEDAEIPVSDVDRELIIMVVGETVRADRFSLNGYGRRTNPMLENQGVISFTRASSCGTSTAISVPCMFSRLTHDEFDSSIAKWTGNLLDVLDEAGVQILWRDNNSNSKGVSERVLTEDFRSADINPVCDTECRDEGMLTGLQGYIDKQSSGDVLIILHQMGSHGPAYYKRYPPEFRKFKPTCDTNELGACTDEEINNAYDNTILYTDHFLSQVIELLAANDHRFETGMVYVGDHGESLGESGMYLHGLPFMIAPEAQTRVPLIMWFGKNYHGVGVSSIKYLKDQPLTHDHVFHTMLGLFEISSEVYQPEMDIMLEASKGTLMPEG